MKIETDLVFTSTGHTACIHSQFAASSLYPLHLGCRIRPVSSAVDAAGVVYGANRALCDHYNQAWFSPRQLRGSVDAAAGTTSFTSDTRPSMLASCTFQPLTATRLATINRPGGTPGRTAYPSQAPFVQSGVGRGMAAARSRRPISYTITRICRTRITCNGNRAQETPHFRGQVYRYKSSQV